MNNKLKPNYNKKKIPIKFDKNKKNINKNIIIDLLKIVLSYLIIYILTGKKKTQELRPGYIGIDDFIYLIFYIIVSIIILTQIYICYKYSIILSLIVTIIGILIIYRHTLLPNYNVKACPSINIDFNKEVTEDELNNIYEILKCNINKTDRCAALSISDNKKYNKKIFIRYHPDIISKKLPNISNEKIDFVSKSIGECLN
tara:strand:+ start:55 stop:654 length:600 start_codon:yes stop_codon:yes gene_type:complete